MRITGQLVDALTGAHVWAERFDGTLQDIFELQDEVAEKVVGQIAPALERAEIERVSRKPTGSLDAYDGFLRGTADFQSYTRDGTDRALQFLERATERDPDFAAAFAMGAMCYTRRKVQAWVRDRAHEIPEGIRLARRAVRLGRDDATALIFAGYTLAHLAGELDDGAELIERALLLNANLASAWLLSGYLKLFLGESDAAIERLAHAIRLSPVDPFIHVMQSASALAHFLAGRFDEACSWVAMALRSHTNFLPPLRVAAASHALAGRSEQAQKMVEALQNLDPTLRVSNLRERLGPHRPSKHLVMYEMGLRKAGVPD